MPNLENHLIASSMNDSDWLKGIYAVVDWVYVHM